METTLSLLIEKDTMYQIKSNDNFQRMHTIIFQDTKRKQHIILSFVF